MSKAPPHLPTVLSVLSSNATAPNPDQFFDLLPLPSLLLTPTLTIAHANGAFFRRFNVARSEIENQSLWTAVGKTFDVPSLRQSLAELEPLVEVNDLYLTIRDVLENTRHFFASARQLSVKGEPFILLMLQDITDTMELKNRLRESEERFSSLTGHMKSAYWITDLARKRTYYISPGFTSIWGRPREALLTSSHAWFDALHPEDRIRITQKVFTELETTVDEYRIIRSDGSLRWVRETIRPIRDATDEIVQLATIAEDLTELKRAENLVLEISAREQSRIGQDMHDGVCQNLTGIKLLSRVLEEKLIAKSMPEADYAAEIGKLVSQALTQADVVAKGLCLVSLDEGGYKTGFKELASTTSKLHDVTCTLNWENDVDLPDRFVATHLYRIAQEAVRNSVKHGKAKNISISLSKAQNKLTLAIQDDGSGLPKAPKRKGMGVHIMKFRARKIGALFSIQKGKEGGTIVNCTFENTERKNKFGRRHEDKITV